MKRKKRKATALPKITLLAYSRADLLAFVEAVGALRHLVNDLSEIAKGMKARRKSRPTDPPGEECDRAT